MILDINQIKDITQGAERIIFEDGKYKFFRFSEEESKTVQEYSLCTAGIILEFKTDANVLKLKGTTTKCLPTRSSYAFEIYVDNKVIGCIKNYNTEEELELERMQQKDLTLGEFAESFNIGDGEKHVKIRFPFSVIAEIEAIELVGATYLTPIKRNKKFIAYGDSITQGFDADLPSKTYAAKLADYLDAEIINKGIGGINFCPELVSAAKDGRQVDYITIAYGTNDWAACTEDEFRKNATDFMDNIAKKYPNVPVLVITPLWRYDHESEEKKFGLFSGLEPIIREACKNHKNMTVVSGFNLIPHDVENFGDKWLHPNNTGFEYYFNNLIKEYSFK